MMEITSVNNTVVKETAKLLQKKYRDETNLFLLEGFKAVEEAFRFGIDIKKIFVLEQKANKYRFLNIELILTTEAVLKKISAADSAPDAVAVAEQKHFSINDIKNCKKIVLLENIKDLGNLGTILRTSAAFNFDAVILFGDCADLYNPKCVRSSVGNLWKVPVVNLKNINEMRVFSDYQKIATLPKAKNLLKNFIAKDRCIIMFGSEADGLSQTLIDFATDSVKIEMSQNVESLNLSISCAIVLYEIFTCK